MNPFKNENSFDYITKNNKIKTFKINNNESVMASNLFFKRNNINWYTKCNRYGWINPYDTDRIVREYLFFTKPDLNIFSDNSIYSNLVGELSNNSVIHEVASRKPSILGQLQSSVMDIDEKYNPFMYLLSNAVTSKLDLPGISSDSQESTTNIMGNTIQYRGHSLKSDNGYDFSLSFKDTAYLEIYYLAKCYDEYIRMLKLGEISPKYAHIVNHIIPEQFSIYKFIVGSDGETIIYYAKLTGCYFVDVPRSEFGDPGDDGFKYSLSFHAQYVDDSNPQILSEFGTVAYRGINNTNNFMDVYDTSNSAVNNKWARYPIIIKADRNDSVYGKRVARRGVAYDYFLKWVQ